jgi:hypothetical protein
MEVEHLATDFQWSQGRSMPDVLSLHVLMVFRQRFVTLLSDIVPIYFLVPR